ncbi:alkaline phosphatase [Candidatus Cyanaurora vandensis]|uniref:alkaline phosphatase D family protein n=1 Tax=Candidatus Cyanaurora vandensis TaxID=2714958 RepID=UPI0025805532|nr:alkaline phosphatase D family protein [Candidatus Cyanaurora vandensis]
MSNRRSILQAALTVPAVLFLPTAGAVTLTDSGVASGEPRPDGVVIWTRVPEYAQTGGAVTGTFKVSLNPDLSAPVVTGSFSTSPTVDYTVKIQVTGLAAFTRYYYGFTTTTGYTSVIGRTKTAPAENSQPAEIRFAYFSCQDFTQGYYTVYANLVAKDDVDFCVHLGDNIYETGAAGFQTGQVREDTIGGGEATTLDHYRQKYKLYLSDPNLLEARRLFPFITLWDDHEVYNDYYGPGVGRTDPNRQRAGYQAFLEYNTALPVEPLSTTNPPKVRMYRQFVFGNLMEMFVLDLRQYRNGPPCRLNYFTPGCLNLDDPNPFAPERTMMGTNQKSWFKTEINNSTRRWKMVLNEMMMQEFKILDVGLFRGVPQKLFKQPYAIEIGLYINLDAWDGYPAERKELLQFIKGNEIKNVVFCTGDIHNCYASELRTDFDAVGVPAAAVEVVGGSVSSAGVTELAGSDLTLLGRPILYDANPSLKYLDLKSHVYTKMVVTAAEVKVTYEAVNTVIQPTSGTFRLAAFSIPDGESRFVF